MQVLVNARQLIPQTGSVRSPAVLARSLLAAAFPTSRLPIVLVRHRSRKTCYKAAARSWARTVEKQMRKAVMRANRAYQFDSDPMTDPEDPQLRRLDDEYAQEAARNEDDKITWKDEVWHRIVHMRGPPPAVGRERDYYYEKLYDKAINFHKLGKLDPDMGKAMLRDGTYIALGNPDNVPLLTKALLKRHFGGMTIDLPPDRLCPPVPNRHLYILWLKELLDTTGPHVNEKSMVNTAREVLGIDVGTGASAIYPLLGCAQRPWKFIATELDETSYEYAKNNLARNGLQHRVRLVRRPKPYHEEDAPLLPLDELGVDRADFVMTNPPFYESEIDMWDRYSEKNLPPLSVNTGAPVEMICEGGEVGFVGKIIDESLVLRDRIQWYTAMLSSPESVEKLLIKLHLHGITNTACTTFVPGKATRRWALAWSFGSRRPTEHAAKGDKHVTTKKISKSLKAPQTENMIPLGPHTTPEELAEQLNGHLAKLDLPHWEWDPKTLTGFGFSNEAVWSRAYRRRKQLEAKLAAADHAPEVETEYDPDADAKLGSDFQGSSSVPIEAPPEALNEDPDEAQESPYDEAETASKHNSTDNKGKGPKPKKRKRPVDQLPTTIAGLEKALAEAESPELPPPTRRMKFYEESMRLNTEYQYYDKGRPGDDNRFNEHKYNQELAQQFKDKRTKARRIRERIEELRMQEAAAAAAAAKGNPAQGEQSISAPQAADNPVAAVPFATPFAGTIEPKSPNLRDNFEFGFKLEIESILLNVRIKDEGRVMTQMIRDSQLKVRWLQGQDPVMYESFVGFLNRGLAKRDGPLARPIEIARDKLERLAIKPLKRSKFEFEEPKFLYHDEERQRVHDLRWQKRWLENRDADFRAGVIPPHRHLLPVSDPLLDAMRPPRQPTAYEPKQPVRQPKQTYYEPEEGEAEYNGW